jgi:adenylate cyclase
MERGLKTINSASMSTCEIKEIADWLIDGARSAPQPAQVLAQLSERLVACGIPLWRVAVFVRTLHPQVMGRRFIWRPGTEVEVSEAPFELLESADSSRIRLRKSMRPGARSAASSPTRIAPWIFRCFRSFALKG